MISPGSVSRRLPKPGSRNPKSFTFGPDSASPSSTRGGSRMRESRTYGSVRGALSNERPYRDRLPCPPHHHVHAKQGGGHASLCPPYAGLSGTTKIFQT